jgi:hypothetical protein
LANAGEDPCNAPVTGASRAKDAFRMGPACAGILFGVLVILMSYRLWYVSWFWDCLVAVPMTSPKDMHA